MRDYVIDANVIMSILISGKASYRPILTYYNFILPEFALIEIEKYKNILKSKSKLQEYEFIQWTYFVFSKLTILPEYVLSELVLKKSEHLLRKIDIKDITYVALALQLDLVLLTRDYPLYNGLTKNGLKKVILFEDFLRKI